MRKRKLNPKRRICLTVDSETVGQLAQMVVYKGNPVHKRNPGDYGLTPTAQPRANKTLCDVSQIFEVRRALALLREGVKQGLVSVQTRNGFPQNIWAVSQNGYALEAQLENWEIGAYHGYPMETEDPLALEVKKRWKDASQ